MNSSFGALYQKIYALICGGHPNQRPWHFQWLVMSDLRRAVKATSENVYPGSKVLDVGCGSKPYKPYLPDNIEYHGLDIPGGSPDPDYEVDPLQAWPIEDNYYDIIICHQVLEHVEDVNLTLSEMARVLKPQGKVIISVPFLYSEHGAPYDFRRFTAYGLERLLSQDFESFHTQRISGVGVTIGIILLNWVEEATNHNKITRFTKAFLLPVWIGFSFVVNLVCYVLNLLDFTPSYYTNVLVTATKK